MIANCASLESIPDLHSYLRVFNISHCESLRRIPDLPRDLESFSVTNCHTLVAIPDLPPHLVIFDMTHVNDALQQYKAKTVHGIIGADILMKGKGIIDY